MAENERLKLTHAEPVDLLDLPPEPVRSAVLKERRRYGRILAGTVAENKKLYDEAYTDPDTGLGNKRMFLSEFPKLFEAAKRHGIPIGLAYADIRGLKRTNDIDGHPAGNRLIMAGAEALTNIAREGDLVARLGGDEFVIVLFGYKPVEGQSWEGLNHTTSNRLTRSFDKSARDHGIPEERHVGLDLSLVIMQDHDTPETMLIRAETEAMAKKQDHYSDLSQQGINFVDRRLQP